MQPQVACSSAPAAYHGALPASTTAVATRPLALRLSQYLTGCIVGSVRLSRPKSVESTTSAPFTADAASSRLLLRPGCPSHDSDCTRNRRSDPAARAAARSLPLGQAHSGRTVGDGARSRQIGHQSSGICPLKQSAQGQCWVNNQSAMKRGRTDASFDS